MTTQEIIIYLIGIATVVLISIRIFKQFNTSQTDACSKCSGCPLKDATNCHKKK